MNETTKFGEDLIQAMTEALGHAQGRDVAGLRVNAVDLETVDAKAIRQKLHLTQDEMAAFLGTSPSGYKKWEQGARQPSGAARTLLRVMRRSPRRCCERCPVDDAYSALVIRGRIATHKGGTRDPLPSWIVVRLINAFVNVSKHR